MGPQHERVRFPRWFIPRLTSTNPRDVARHVVVAQRPRLSRQALARHGAGSRERPATRRRSCSVRTCLGSRPITSQREAPIPMTNFSRAPPRRLAPVLLPNAWDVPSALAFADAGLRGDRHHQLRGRLRPRPPGRRAGDPGGEPRASPARWPGCPCYITMDIEDGYADEPEGRRVRRRARCRGRQHRGQHRRAARRAQAFAAKVAAIKAPLPRAVRQRPRRHVLAGRGRDGRRDARRAAAYVEAGADGVFVPGAADPTCPRAGRGHPGAAERPRRPRPLPRRAGRARRTPGQHRLPAVPRRAPRRRDVAGAVVRDGGDSAAGVPIICPAAGTDARLRRIDGTRSLAGAGQPSRLARCRRIARGLPSPGCRHRRSTTTSGAGARPG